MARGFFRKMVDKAQFFVSDEHSAVDDMMIEDRSVGEPERYQRTYGPSGEHGRHSDGESARVEGDPEARPYRKSRNADARLAHLG
jgi:hypothetical protein